MTKSLQGLDIDATLCISLNNREDRRASLLESFSKSGLDIEFFLVDKDEEDQQRGCYDSHRACAQMILQRGYKRALILEDDCVLSCSPSHKTVAHINRFLNRNNPEIFYLGVLLGKIWLTWFPGIARCRGQGMHAYIISAQGCQTILSWEAYAGKGIDNLFSKRFKGYCAFPMMCFQSHEFSTDIEIYRDNLGEKHTKAQKTRSDRENFHRQQKRKQYTSALGNWYKTLLCQ
ncbi:MAG: glycosyltransferase family 25 protein [Azoarcus sp.]|jgi:glycosyl transferase family 25|nr:glycosyltransferase family 25 protein [Azoarcus sp.]